MKRDFLPVKVYRGNKRTEIWYIDISGMSISKLLELRNDLLGSHDMSIRIIDGIISKDSYKGSTYYQRWKCESKDAKFKMRRKGRRYQHRKRKYK